MTFSFKDALAGGGNILIGAAMLAGVLLGAVGEKTVGPVDNIYDEIASSPAASPCKPGWQDTSAIDEHHTVLSCERTVNGERWLVILNEDSSFNQATILDVPGAIWITDASLVPEWR